MWNLKTSYKCSQIKMCINSFAEMIWLLNNMMQAIVLPTVLTLIGISLGENDSSKTFGFLFVHL